MTDRTRGSDELRDEHPGAGEQAGEGVGGIGGTVGGAALGSLAGPVGTIIGGIAGAVGGWWAGEKVGRAVEDADRNDEDYRRDYASLDRTDDIDYSTARIGYGVGYVASYNPDYRNRDFNTVETDLRRGWRSDQADYERVRPYVQRGYERGLRTRRSD
jgi:uncharacterized protein YcfJ